METLPLDRDGAIVLQSRTFDKGMHTFATPPGPHYDVRMAETFPDLPESAAAAMGWDVPPVLDDSRWTEARKGYGSELREEYRHQRNRRWHARARRG